MAKPKKENTAGQKTAKKNYTASSATGRMVVRDATTGRLVEKNTNGVKVPVRPLKTPTVITTEARLKRVTTKHRKAIDLLAKR